MERHACGLCALRFNTTCVRQDSEKQGNAAFSPLGHSAILAALAEGATGKTRAQMLAALKLPQDSSLTRATYRSVLGRMKVRARTACS